MKSKILYFSHQRIVKLIVLLVLLFITLLSIYLLINSRSFQFFGGLVQSINTNNKVIALTFDDGPEPETTDELLTILENNNVKATFFLIGKNIDRHPNETKALITAGHQIGNHSYSHPRLVFMLPSMIRQEVDKTTDAIKANGYSGKIMFRPPYGKKLVYLPYYLHSQNMRTIMWSIEPETYGKNAKNSSEIVQYTVENAHPGAIIILHGMHKENVATRAAIEPIIVQLRQEGYTFVTVDQLLAQQ